jgi:hypothetical protein
MIAVAAVLILLHAPGGRVIQINPEAVVSLTAAVEGQSNKSVSDAVRCIINTMDGKFISVIESCEEISRMIGRPQGDQP